MVPSYNGYKNNTWSSKHTKILYSTQLHKYSFRFYMCSKNKRSLSLLWSSIAACTFMHLLGAFIQSDFKVQGTYQWIIISVWKHCACLLYGGRGARLFILDYDCILLLTWMSSSKNRTGSIDRFLYKHAIAVSYWSFTERPQGTRAYWSLASVFLCPVQMS